MVFEFISVHEVTVRPACWTNECQTSDVERFSNEFSHKVIWGEKKWFWEEQQYSDKWQSAKCQFKIPMLENGSEKKKQICKGREK